MIRIGVAGWDYADWIGPVYPARVARGMDRLAFLARYVDVVEINATFYRPAAPRACESWLRRTASRGPAFTFSAKAHRSWTHEDAGAIDPRRGLGGLTVLRDAGKLAALLLQFPQSFRDAPRSRERLRRLAGTLGGWPTAVELRHVSWQAPAARAWFGELQLAWCVVDQPRVGRHTAGPGAHVAASPAYLRLHGRNAADWFRAEAGRDARYDYLYSTAELEALAGVARAMAAQAEELIVVLNNHFRGQALVNALQLKPRLQGVRPAAPDSLVAAYPGLEQVVAIERSGLF